MDFPIPPPHSWQILIFYPWLKSKISLSLVQRQVSLQQNSLSIMSTLLRPTISRFMLFYTAGTGFLIYLPRRHAFSPYYSKIMAAIIYLQEVIFGPRREKTCLLGFRTTKTQTSLSIRSVWSAPLLFAFCKVSMCKLATGELSIF